MSRLPKLKLSGICVVCGRRKESGTIISYDHCSKAKNDQFVCKTCCKKCEWFYDNKKCNYVYQMD